MKTYFLIITVCCFAAIGVQTWQPLQTRIDVRESENYAAFLAEYNQAKQQLNLLQMDTSGAWYISKIDTTSIQQP